MCCCCTGSSWKPQPCCPVQHSSFKLVASMVTATKMTVGTLNDLRDEDRFQVLFEDAVMLCRESDVPFPELPRQRRPPKRVAQRQHTLGQLQTNTFAISSFRLWTLQSPSWSSYMTSQDCTAQCTRTCNWKTFWLLLTQRLMNWRPSYVHIRR